MTKENILFAIVGLLLGLIVGFMFANSVNRNAGPAGPVAGFNQPGGLPEGHPDMPGGSAQQPGAMGPEVLAAIETAKNEPDNFEAQVKAAELYNRIQRFDSAIEFLTRANQLKPDDYEVIVRLGNTNFDAEKYAEAEKWYAQALEKKPADVNVRTDLGLTYIFRDPPDYDRSIKEFNQSLETDPTHQQTLQNLTVAYAKKGDAENAQATLARLEKTDPNNTAIPQLRAEIGKAGAK